MYLLCVYSAGQRRSDALLCCSVTYLLSSVCPWVHHFWKIQNKLRDLPVSLELFSTPVSGMHSYLGAGDLKSGLHAFAARDLSGGKASSPQDQKTFFQAPKILIWANFNPLVLFLNIFLLLVTWKKKARWEKNQDWIVHCSCHGTSVLIRGQLIGVRSLLPQQVLGWNFSCQGFGLPTYNNDGNFHYSTHIFRKVI